jgi:hypothetical protein
VEAGLEVLVHSLLGVGQGAFQLSYALFVKAAGLACQTMMDNTSVENTSVVNTSVNNCQ